MHVNLEQKKIYHNVDINIDKSFRFQRFVYKHLHNQKCFCLYVKVGCHCHIKVTYYQY